MARRVVWPKIVLFGDSLTQFSFSNDGCWGALVANTFQRKADVLNRGFSGYNSRACLEVLPYITPDISNAEAVTLFIGANDATDQNLNPIQYVPLCEYKQNLVKFINTFKTMGVKNIVLITPPALDATAWKNHCKTEGKPDGGKTEATTAAYAAACLSAAQAENVNYVNLHAEMLKDDNWRGALCDGLHFSQKGSVLLANLLIPILEKIISTDVECKFPDWKELDNQNLEANIKKWVEKA